MMDQKHYKVHSLFLDESGIEGRVNMSDYSRTALSSELVSHLVDQGRFDQHNPNDRSREETRSSWSSSEEALAACEGLIYNVALNGHKNCSSGAAK